MKRLFVSAGGKGERIADYCERVGVKTKHLLPVKDTNLLLHNCKQVYFNRIIVSASSQNVSWFEHFLKGSKQLSKKVSLSVDFHLTGPLGPIYREMKQSKTKTFFLATADAYCDFDWGDFVRFHNSHNYPVSLLIAKSIPVKSGATFQLGESFSIEKWVRKPVTTSDDLINIGYYCINTDSRVRDVFKKMAGEHKEDLFFDLLIERGLVAGYQCPIAFNINTFETYQGLQDYIEKSL